ncbi:hypothetical protein [Mesorhizobium sp. M0205]|uniref:hypothetical protein n=1 Tax=Mesorhizobium sp. M0205 TaxID=2956914 RepID=UPI00268984FD
MARSVRCQLAAGLDGVAMDGFGKTKTVNDEMEAEVDEAAVERPDEYHLVYESVRSFLIEERVSAGL